MDREILLTQGKSTLVSEEDYDFLMKWKWRTLKNGCGNYYAARGEYLGVIEGKQKRRIVLLHRIVLARKLGRYDFQQVDHIDRNGLNNSRENLRPVTHKQNQENRSLNKNSTSGVRGVSWEKKAKKWRVQVGSIHIGYFDSIHSAEVAAITARQQFFTHSADELEKDNERFSA